MSQDGPRQSATRRPETARRRATAGRANSSGLTWILPMLSFVNDGLASRTHRLCHEKTPSTAGPFLLAPPKRRVTANTTRPDCVARPHGCGYILVHEWIAKRHERSV